MNLNKLIPLLYEVILPILFKTMLSLSPTWAMWLAGGPEKIMYTKQAIHITK